MWITVAILSFVAGIGALLLHFNLLDSPQAKPEQRFVIRDADVEPKRRPPVLPSEGSPIGAERNQVWETRDGTLFDISAPIRGELIGHEKPRVIDQERGWTSSRMMAWRLDGVATSGEANLDLVKARPDLDTHFKFDEDGYVRRAR